MKMTRLTLLFLMISLLLNCSGSSSSSTVTPEFDPTPSFTPTETESLENLVINTFTDNGVQITVSPEYLDFNSAEGEINKDQETELNFELTNNSGETRKFNFQIYSVSAGFSILNDKGENIGSYSAIEIENGETIAFAIRFNAWSFGLQSGTLTITADVSGYIQMPFQAMVSGAADFRIIPSGYLCSDLNAPVVTQIDFLKVSSGVNRVQTIKICNTGGEDISVYSSQISQGSSTDQSKALQNNSFEEFLWTVTNEINSSFAFGEQPNQSGSFVEPVYQDYPQEVTDSAESYSIAVHHSGDAVSDLLLEAGQLLAVDVVFAPDLNLEAPDGVTYNPKAINALLTLETSLGPVEIPLLGASSGIEPVLKLSYRFGDSEAYREIDLNAESPAIHFDQVGIFLDWVSSNSKTAEIMIENIGSGTKNLQFFGGTINGFFEYYWDDISTPLSFPLSVAPGNASILKIRYIPSATQELSESYDATWDFGQFYFQHNGGNGPYGKATLVGEQDAGFAVELYYGGSNLKHDYNESEYKNLCVFSTKASNPTTKTFRVVNNNIHDTMEVNWKIKKLDAGLNASVTNGTLTVPPASENTFSIDFTADASSSGSLVGGTLRVKTRYPDSEYEGSASLDDLLFDRNFVVPFKATGSDTGTSSLCGGGVLGAEDTMQVTYIMDRVILALAPSLPESNRNPPGFKYHFPLEFNLEKGTARISKPTPFIWDKNDPEFSPVKQIRSFIHQATNIQGCAPLPSNPYRLEFQKGSWTGAGIECQDGDIGGTVTFSDPNNESGPITVNTDTACMDNNGGEEYTDANNVRWVVFYHDFLKYENCVPQYYGKVSTVAFRPDLEEIYDVYERAEAKPDESEAFYESVYGTYQHESYITFFEKIQCGSLIANPGDTITDPDEIKSWYTCFASNSDETSRDKGFIDECSYFNFSIDAGIIPEDADSPNPDRDSWSGFGTYEPHVDDEGTLHPTKYDLTIYNAHMKALVVGAGDRVKFFGHPGHLVYSDVYATLTTKRVATEESLENGTWQDEIAVETRPHFDKDQILLEDGNPISIKTYWTEDGMSEELSNSISPENFEPGVNYGGAGKGNFRWVSGSTNKIIPAGWPINYDENNLAVIIALGTFTGQGNTAPSFAKADSATGKGKSLYFAFHGCMVAGEPSENQGCYDYYRDNATLKDGSDTPIIDAYVDAEMLISGYPDDPADCSLLSDAGFEDPFNYKYMSCINFRIMDRDRDQYTNYYESNNFFYEENMYTSTTCGQGM